MNQHFERVNVRDFGAKGDGVTNDAPAIQAALDSVAEKGGVVFMPAGAYRMNNGVVVPFGVRVEGITTATTGPWQNYLDTADKGFPLPEGIRFDTLGDNWIEPKLFKGTWVICDHDAGNPEGEPTFRMEGNTSITRVGFVNRSMPPVSETVIPCPPVSLISPPTTCPTPVRASRWRISVSPTATTASCCPPAVIWRPAIPS